MAPKAFVLWALAQGRAWLQSPFGFVLLDIYSDFGLAEQFVHHNDQLDLLNKEDTKAVNKKKSCKQVLRSEDKMT